MRREIAERWIEALESGDYVQGQGQLRADGEYCCLGVLCELAMRDGLPIAPADGNGYEIEHVVYAAMPPIEVYRWSGLTTEDADGYADMNDTEGASFRVIAEEIRRRNDL